MSSMDLRVTVTAEALIDAVAELGGEIEWKDQPARTARIGIEGEVDQEDAADAMNASWFEPEDQPWGPDPRDFGDFVSACTRGDRLIAGALLPRLTDAPAAQAAAEQMLLRMGGRA